MQGTLKIPLPKPATLRAYLEAKVESVVARTEIRGAAFTRDEVGDRAKRLQREVGEDGVKLWDAMIRERVKHAYSRQPSPPEEAAAALAAQFGDDVAAVMLPVMRSIDARIAYLRAKPPASGRDLDLHQLPVVRKPPGGVVGYFQGEWAEDRPFPGGSMVVDRGMIWLAVRDAISDERPGTSGAWNLLGPVDKREESPEGRRGAPLYDAGTWKPDGDYMPGDVVTHKGTMWVARAATTARPGASEDWRLMIKTQGKNQ